MLIHAAPALLIMKQSVSKCRYPKLPLAISDIRIRGVVANNGTVKGGWKWECSVKESQQFLLQSLGFQCGEIGHNELLYCTPPF